MNHELFGHYCVLDAVFRSRRALTTSPIFIAISFQGIGIEQWEVGKVQDFSYMFYGAMKFDGNISGWDTSNAKIMTAMFQMASTFNGNIGNWDVSNVRNMDYIFSQTVLYEGHNLIRWNVSC